jgi:hypothetical protein
VFKSKIAQSAIFRGLHSEAYLGWQRERSITVSPGKRKEFMHQTTKVTKANWKVPGLSQKNINMSNVSQETVWT